MAAAPPSSSAPVAVSRPACSGPTPSCMRHLRCSVARLSSVGSTARCRNHIALLLPCFISASFCCIVSYPLMSLVMTSAPLAMKICGLSVSDSNFGIQWHIVAMYGPSFFTGSLIARFGAPKVVATGLLLEAVAATIGLTGITAIHFWATLMVLGVGWNFGFVGASALVLETHRPQERNKVQAFNDFLVFGVMALGSFSSGQLLANYGWSAVNLVVYPPVLLGLTVLAFASFAKRRRRLQVLAEFPDPSI